ncbi:MAG: 30S ribosomal protein S27e [Candidatus Pacearchaeota archaeon]|nr:30S ribosomal protein S27e [Candidatus Pacearchaeota archaeon]
MVKIKQITSKFLEIFCPRCKKQKIVFGKSSTKVKCEKCNYLLLKTSGGKSKIRAKVRKVIP